MTLFAAADSARLGLFLKDYGPVLVPVALGFLGIYLLLPQVLPHTRRWQRAWGAICAALALVFGWYTMRQETVLIEQILFYSFAGIAVAAGILLIAHKNPVYAALSFALVVLSTCGLFLLQAAPFLMAATIVVTFLFVIMLAQQAGATDADQRSREPFLASLAGFVVMAAILCVLHRNYDTRELDDLIGQLRQVADAKTPEQVIAVLGDPDKRPANQLTHPLVDALNKYFPGEDAVSNLETNWLALRQSLAFERLQADSRLILMTAPQRRVLHGSLAPSGALPLSKLGGTPPNAEQELKPDGSLPERLPAANVKGLGIALFTDYLLPVELAGVLLLVATIGAIAIAGRRAEVLR